MNYFNLAAALLTIFLGIAHSFLGEHFIFRHLRKNGHWIDTGFGGLRTRQIRSLWSTWHLISLFGWGIAFVLLILAFDSPQNLIDMKSSMLRVLSITFMIATPFWLIGTKGKHPAWIVFFVIALLIWFGH